MFALDEVEGDEPDNGFIERNLSRVLGRATNAIGDPLFEPIEILVALPEHMRVQIIASIYERYSDSLYLNGKVIKPSSVRSLAVASAERSDVSWL